MKTIQSYLQDPDTLEIVAKVTSITPGERTSDVGTNVSPFYVQGGGQPSDAGWLVTASGSTIVRGVRLIDGALVHTIEPKVSLDLGQEIVLRVDAIRRMLHCRLHTAGELVCLAVKQVAPKWTMKSAIHFPDNASVTFEPDAGLRLDNQLAAEVERVVNSHIEAAYEVSIMSNVARDRAEAMTKYALTGLPADARIRLVHPAPDFYRACMGTHVRNTREIGPIRVRKLKLRKGLATVSYELASETSSADFAA
jgi:Ser-tRNA(Ala) deacylase AlaX